MAWWPRVPPWLRTRRSHQVAPSQASGPERVRAHSQIVEAASLRPAGGGCRLWCWSLLSSLLLLVRLGWVGLRPIEGMLVATHWRWLARRVPPINELRGSAPPGRNKQCCGRL